MRSWLVRGVLLLVVAFGTVTPLRSQAPQASDPKPLAFEVASVRRSAPRLASALDTQTQIAESTGRWSVRNAELSTIVMMAYHMPREQIMGGPAWFDRELFDINATASSGATREDMLLMVRSLLAERFGLRLHIDSRPLDAFALVLARSDGTLGPGMRRSAIDCTTLSDAERRPPAPGTRRRAAST